MDLLLLSVQQKVCKSKSKWIVDLKRDTVTRITVQIYRVQKHIYSNGKLQVVVHFLKNSKNTVSVKKL